MFMKGKPYDTYHLVSIFTFVLGDGFGQIGLLGNKTGRFAHDGDSISALNVQHLPPCNQIFSLNISLSQV